MLLINCISLNLNINILCSIFWLGGDVEIGLVVLVLFFVLFLLNGLFIVWFKVVEIFNRSNV